MKRIGNFQLSTFYLPRIHLTIPSLFNSIEKQVFNSLSLEGEGWGEGDKEVALLANMPQSKHRI